MERRSWGYQRSLTLYWRELTSSQDMPEDSGYAGVLVLADYCPGPITSALYTSVTDHTCLYLLSAVIDVPSKRGQLLS